MKRTTTTIIALVGILLAGSHHVRASQQEQSKHTIVPGVGVGEYTLGMSKDDVLRKLGEPEAIQLGEDEPVRRGEEKYSLNNLPSEYILSFGDVSFWINDDSVQTISVHSPLYKLSNGLGVGDSEQKIKQAFGEDFQLEEALGKDFRCYHAKGLGFEIDKKNQTVAEIVVYQPEGDPRVLRTLPKYDPASLRNPDLRCCDLTKLDLRKSIEDLMYADFDDRTVWPAPNRMPSEFDWKKVMELGKNPGLGVRSLHKKGITGRGVRVAILDQPLLVDHQEYGERLRLYEEIDLQGRTHPSFHGAAVASIALGKTVGVAPEAELYYIAQWNVDWDNKRTDSLRTLARGIHRMLEINERLPKDNKIRVISISRGWTRSHKDYKEITEAVQKAQAAGMLVVCSGLEYVHEGLDFGVLGRSPLADPEVFESYEPGLFGAKQFWARRPSPSDRSSPSGVSFSIPMDSRTTASETGNDEYVFHRIGGYSWAIPYIAGVYALAVQVDPAITPERFWALAVQTGRTIELNYNGKTRALGPIINPVRLIRAIQAGEPAMLNRQQSDTQPTETHPQMRSGAHTIVPGVRIGAYTLDMSEDDVLKELGEPEAIQFGEDEVVRRGEEKYSLSNLPSECILAFGDVSFWIEDDSVQAISVRSPLYKLSNGLGVGDSEQKIKQAFGEDFRLEEALGKDFRCYHARGLGFEIHKKNQTVAEIVVYQTEGDRGDRDAPDSGKEIMLSEQSPGPITFPKIDRKPKPDKERSRELKTLSKYNPDSGNPFQVDLRCRDLTKLDLRNSIENLMYADFDDRTVWPAPNQMPSDFNWQKIMELGKNPGLRVRSLHKKGITGRGVRVAIIDQPLLVDHQEYAERVRLYEETDLHGATDPSMHGAAVASIAVGKTVGVAPEAELYYIAQWTWHKGTLTLRTLAQSIHRILEINEQLPKGKKIRVISISKGWLTSHDDYDEIMAACEEAKAAGIFVVSCSLE